MLPLFRTKTNVGNVFVKTVLYKLVLLIDKLIYKLCDNKLMY